MKKIKIALLLVIAMIGTACVKGDFDGCPSGLRLNFFYLIDNDVIRFNNTDADQIVVFAFDDQGVYYEKYTTLGTDLIEGYKMDIPIAPGEYSFLIWAGSLSDYTTAEESASSALTTIEKGVTTIEEFRFLFNGVAEVAARAATRATELEITHRKNLYYALDQTIIVPPYQIVERRVEMIRDTKQIIVTINGLSNALTTPALPSEVPLDVFFWSTNGMYNFRNELDLGSNKIKYLAESSQVDGQKYISSTKIMRVVIGSDIRLHVVERQTGIIIIDVNTMDIILASGQYLDQRSIDYEDRFEIEFNFPEGPGHTVTITVNGWQITEVIPIVN